MYHAVVVNSFFDKFKRLNFFYRGSELQLVFTFGILMTSSSKLDPACICFDKTFFEATFIHEQTTLMRDEANLCVTKI